MIRVLSSGGGGGGGGGGVSQGALALRLRRIPHHHHRRGTVFVPLLALVHNLLGSRAVLLLLLLLLLCRVLVRVRQLLLLLLPSQLFVQQSRDPAAVVVHASAVLSFVLVAAQHVRRRRQSSLRVEQRLCPVRDGDVARQRVLMRTAIGATQQQRGDGGRKPPRRHGTRVRVVWHRWGGRTILPADAAAAVAGFVTSWLAVVVLVLVLVLVPLVVLCVVAVATVRCSTDTFVVVTPADSGGTDVAMRSRWIAAVRGSVRSCRHAAPGPSVHRVDAIAGTGGATAMLTPAGSIVVVIAVVQAEVLRRLVLVDFEELADVLVLFFLRLFLEGLELRRAGPEVVAGPVRVAVLPVAEANHGAAGPVFDHLRRPIFAAAPPLVPETRV